mgnify:CR=1 FL=1
MSECPLRPHSRPTARAVTSSSGGTRTEGSPSNRATRACRGPPRQACATTPAGTSKAVPTSNARRSRARTLASPPPARVRATPPCPESDLRPRRPLSSQAQCLVGPRTIVRAYRTELSIEVVQQHLKTVLVLSTSNRRTGRSHRARFMPALQLNRPDAGRARRRRAAAAGTRLWRWVRFPAYVPSRMARLSPMTA